MACSSNALILLQRVIEHRAKAITFEDGCYPISDGADCVRPGKPDVQSAEVQELLATGVVSYIRTSHKDALKDSVLRLMHQDLPRAEAMVADYVATLRGAPVVETTTCAHDYDNAVRMGRAFYVCPKCKADVSMMIYMLWEAEAIRYKNESRA